MLLPHIFFKELDMLTWQDLINQVVDLGFEEDTITSEEEYGRLIRNSINRALGIIRTTVVMQIEGYLENIEQWGYSTTTEVTDEDGDTEEVTEWNYPKMRNITISTDLTSKVQIPEVLEPLLPLLSAHYVWLDDDLTKATIYWNEYDDLKTQIINNCNRPRKVKIVGGF